MLVSETLIAALEAKNITLHSIAYGMYNVTSPGGSLQISLLAPNPALSHVFYFKADWMLTKPDLVAASIAYKLQLCKRVFARHCSIKRIPNSEAIAFLNRHHFLGGIKSAYPIGLFYNSNCIAVAQFSKGRKMNRLPETLRSYELLRYATHMEFQISGGLSKLIHHFTSLKNPGDIMTYVDARYFNGKSFKSLGFKEYPSAIPHNLKLVYARTL